MLLSGRVSVIFHTQFVSRDESCAEFLFLFSSVLFFFVFASLVDILN